MLWRGENESFLRENEKKVNEGKPEVGLSVNQLLFLKLKMFWALWRRQKEGVEPAFKKLKF